MRGARASSRATTTPSATSAVETFPTKPGRIPSLVQGVAQALDKGDVKGALKRSEVILERHPAHAFCKGLRALALDLSGSRSEAIVHCREVKLAKATDPCLLSYVKLVFERAGLYDEVASAYEAALEEDPQNEDNAVSLFLALASALKLQRQQTVAVGLYRRHGGSKYLLWAVGAILAQVPNFGPHRSLDLADMLMQRIPVDITGLKRDGVEANKLYNSFHVLVAHLTSLRQQGKYQQALQMLEVHEEAAAFTLDVASLRLKLLAEARLGGAVEVARLKFMRSVDQWNACKEYIALAFSVEGFLNAPAAHAETMRSEELTAGERAEEDDSPASPLSMPSPAHGGLPLSFDSPKASPLAALQMQATTMALPGGAKAGEAKAELLDFAGRTAGASARKGAGVDAGGTLRNANRPFLTSLSTTFQRTPSAGSVELTAQESTAPTDQEVHDAYMILMRLQANSREHGSRVPFLGELEMRALAFASSEAESLQRAVASGELVDHRSWLSVVSHGDLNAFTEEIAAYVAKYGQYGTSCCFDLKPYLCLLDEKHAHALLERFQNSNSGNTGDTGEAAPDVAESNRYIATVQLQRSLRRFENLTLEQAASEVSTLLLKWSELHEFGSAEQPAGNGGKLPSTSDPRGSASDCIGLRDESRPTVEPDELIMIAAAHLIDMDRAYCAQVAGTYPGSGGSRGRLPAMQDRVYIIDALALLESVCKLSPRNVRMRLLLAVIYGSVGAALPLRKYYDSAKFVCAQHEAFGHLLMERLLTLGWWSEVPEFCKDLHQFHDTFERAARAELANVYEYGGAQGALHRSREYAGILDSMNRSVMRGRAIVEDLLVEAAHSGDCGEALYDMLNLQIRRLRDIAMTPTTAWSTASQDRSLFKDLHFLPRCTPLQAVHLGAIGAPMVAPPRGGMLAPPAHWSAVFRPSPAGAVVSSAATLWHTPSANSGSASRSAAPSKTPQVSTSTTVAAQVTANLPPLPPWEPSGLEEVLAQRRESSPGVLKLRALLLVVVHALLKPHPSEAEISEIVKELQTTLVAEGLAAHCEPAALFREARMPNAAAFGASSGSVPVAMAARAAAPDRRSSDSDSRKARLKGQRGKAQKVASDGRDTSSDRGNRDVPGSDRGYNLSMRKLMAGEDYSAREQDDVSSGAPETAPLGIDDPKSGLPPPWRPALITADDLFWRCTVIACDAAHRTLQASVASEPLADSVGYPSEGPVRRDAGQPLLLPEVSKDRNAGDALICELMAPPSGTQAVWEAPRRCMEVLRLLVRECARSVLEGCPYASEDYVGLGVGGSAGAAALVAAGGTVTAVELHPSAAVRAKREVAERDPLVRAEPFRLGGHGVHTLCAFLTGPMVVMLPIISFISSRVMKPTARPLKCSPMKAEEIARRMRQPPPGGPAADETRKALGQLADELRAVLKEIYAALVEAQADEFDHLRGGCPMVLAPRIVLPRGYAIGDREIDNARRMVGKSLVGSHRRQLSELERVVRSYITQLKDLNTKPK